MLFKTDRIKREFAELDERNPRLKEALLKIEQICDEQGLDEPVLTSLYRSPEENGKVNGIDKSPHCLWEGADLRSTIYRREEIQDLIRLVNALPYKYHNKPTLIHHQVAGQAPHMHLQVLRKEDT